MNPSNTPPTILAAFLFPALALLFLQDPWVRSDEKHSAQEAKAWVERMKQVHAQFKGSKGTFATYGDSNTVSMAFWSPLRHNRKNISAEGEAAFKLVNHYMKPECWDKWRGPGFGNEGGMTILWADKNVKEWLQKHNPETALIMFGTNDLTSVPPDTYGQKLRDVVKACLDNGTVVILSTIPPRSGMLKKSRQLADIARQVAKEMKVPLCDYFAQCLKRRPDDWDGAAPKFKDFKGYDVPTLIARDGVHPSYPKKYQGDFSEEALKCNGYNLRSYVSMLAYAEVIRNVLEARNKEPRTK
jgi:GDSL-like lipase/acylhydrolase family protein